MKRSRDERTPRAASKQVVVAAIDEHGDWAWRLGRAGALALASLEPSDVRRLVLAYFARCLFEREVALLDADWQRVDRVRISCAWNHVQTSAVISHRVGQPVWWLGIGLSQMDEHNNVYNSFRGTLTCEKMRQVWHKTERDPSCSLLLRYKPQRSLPGGDDRAD